MKSCIKNIICKTLLIISIGCAICFMPGAAEAARSFTVAQTPATVVLIMGTTNNPMTFRVTNNSTAGETITSVRFNINNTYTALPNPETFVAPNWNCTRSSNTRVTCTAIAAAYYITPGTNKDFTFNIDSIASTTDRTDQLARASARFSGSNIWRNPNSTTSSWTWKLLSMTLVPSTYSVGTGCQFTLTMTVTNKSTAAVTVTSVTKPPTPTGVSVSTTSNPANLSLGAFGSGSETGSMVWTYTAGGTPGTVTFTACASTGASCTTVSGTSKTSSTVTTPAITITSGSSCSLTAAIAVTPTCLFSGDTATFVMTVTNNTGGAVNNVVPSALTKFTTGTAAIGAFTGPSPASIASIANGASGTFTWTAPVTGNVALPSTDTYYVTGYATATGPITTSTATSNTEDVDGYIVSVVPTATNAGSANEELVWTITNNACNNINQVSIAAPGGWTASSDGYAVVTNTLGNVVDTWTLAGTTFTSPSATDRIPLTSSGVFSLVFSATPTTTGNYTFNVTITDDAATPIVKVSTTTITVNAFGSGGLNDAATGVWREEVK